MYLFQIYHNFTKLRKDNVTSLTDPKTWPDSWKNTYIKTYPRFPTIQLPRPKSEILNTSLHESIYMRQSTRTFNRPANIDQLSSLLFYSIGEKKKGVHDTNTIHRMYPSGGARYPLEFYVLTFKDIGELKTGLYHYNITEHGLTDILNGAKRVIDVCTFAPQEYVQHAQFMIIFTAVMSRGVHKYGERTYRFTLLEAGAAMQNFGLIAAALNIGGVNIAGVFDAELEATLDIDGTDETLIHTMFFG